MTVSNEPGFNLDPPEPQPNVGLPIKKSANATEAPTSGVTLGAAELSVLAKGSLSDEEFDFVNIVHQWYRTDGTILSAPVGLEVFDIPEQKFRKLIGTESVKTALLARGVPLREVPTERWQANSLSAEQLFVADVMLDLNDTRSNKKKLQDMKISTARWDSWLREPAFAAYLDANTSQLLKNAQHEAALALVDKVKMGDLKAIQFYYEYTNRFVSNARQTAGNENADLFNARQLINDLVEIIIDEVDDHEIAARVADRLKALMNRNQIVQGLTNPEQPEIIVPEAVPTRALTSKQKDLMDQGVGMET